MNSFKPRPSNTELLTARADTKAATPRPWKTYQQGDCDTGITSDAGRVGETIVIDCGYEIAEANAALIVEAVNQHASLKAQNAELAAALRGLLGPAEARAQAEDQRSAHSRLFTERLASARAALAKVKP